MLQQLTSIYVKSLGNHSEGLCTVNTAGSYPPKTGLRMQTHGSRGFWQIHISTQEEYNVSMSPWGISNDPNPQESLLPIQGKRV